MLLAVMTLESVSAAAQAPEVIDRIVAAINHTYIITASDVRRERSVMAALGEPSKSDREIVDDLIGWRLLEEQMSQFPGLDVTDDELAAGLEAVDSIAASIDEIRIAVRQRIRRKKYIDRRFGQFIHVTEEEKRQYYRDVFVPAARKAGIDSIPELAELPSEIHDRLVRNLIEEKTSSEVLSALDALRARSDVEIF